MAGNSFLNNLVYILLVSVFLFSFNPSNAENEQYPMSCGQSWDIEPVCMDFPISSQSDFNSCKAEVQKYFKALDYHLECTSSSFTKYINERVKKVRKHVICVNDYMEAKRQKNPTGSCPPLGRVYFMPSKIGLFTHEDWKEPTALYSRYCYEATEHSNDDVKSIMCRVGWDAFLDLDSGKYGMNADKNAKFLHDEYIDRLIYVVKEEKELNVGCFNAWARGTHFSLNCP